MNDKWEQWPPIEGNDTDPLGTIAVVLSLAFALSMMVYVLTL
jgi:hypothetical protein